MQSTCHIHASRDTSCVLVTWCHVRIPLFSREIRSTSFYTGFRYEWIWNLDMKTLFWLQRKGYLKDNVEQSSLFCQHDALRSSSILWVLVAASFGTVILNEHTLSSNKNITTYLSNVCCLVSDCGFFFMEKVAGARNTLLRIPLEIGRASCRERV